MGRRAPLDADATRGAHFKRIAGSGGFVIAVTALAVAAFVWGAAESNTPVLAGAPPGILAVALVIAFIIADRRAETDFFSGFAQQRGLLYYDEGAVLELTPLLGAGDRRRCNHMMEGVFRGRTAAPDPLHLRDQARVVAPGPVPRTAGRSATSPSASWTWRRRCGTFKGFFLRKRRGMFDKLDDDEWLSGRGLPRVELESIAFNERYEMFRDRAMDENLLRQLFSPSLVQWLAQHPLAPGVEFKAGTLVVFLEECVEEAGKLDWVLEAAVELSARVSKEASEALPGTA